MTNFGNRCIKHLGDVIRTSDGVTVTTVVMSAVTITIILAFGTLPGLFADEQKAIDILEKQGFSNIKIVNKDWVFVALVGCGQGDAAMFTAQATNPIGKNVEIKVCVGWPFKGATIRN